MGKSTGKGGGKRADGLPTGVPFSKGSSGNPGGRPRAYRDYLRELIGEHGEKAFDVLWAIAQGNPVVSGEVAQEAKDAPTLPRYEWPSVKERADAARTLLEHLNGRPVQALENGDGGQLVIQVVELK